MMQGLWNLYLNECVPSSSTKRFTCINMEALNALDLYEQERVYISMYVNVSAYCIAGGCGCYHP